VANKRDVEIDVTVDDKTGPGSRSAARNVDELARRVRKASAEAATAQRSARQDVDAFNARLGDLAKRAGAMAARVAGSLGVVAGGAGLTATGMFAAAKASVALAAGAQRAGVALGPLLGALPALAAGAVFARLAAQAMGPALLAAVSPVTEAWRGLSERVGRVAAADVPAVSRAFVRANFPGIERDTTRVAAAVNRSVLAYGRWAASAEGVAAVSAVTGGVAAAADRASPALTRTAIALSGLAGRAAGPVFDRLAGLIERIADKTTKWADSITESGIESALDTVSRAADAFGGKLRMVVDAVKWAADNTDKVRAASDALGALALAIGLGTGNPVAIAVGALTLIGNHYDAIKAKAITMRDKIAEVWGKIGNDPNVIKIKDALKEIKDAIGGDMTAMWDLFKSAVSKAAEAGEKLWNAIGPKVAELMKNKEFQNGVRILAFGLGALTLAILGLAAASLVLSGLVVVALGYLVGWLVGAVSAAFQTFMNAATTAFTTVLRAAADAAEALGMKSVADKLRATANDIEKFVDKVNDALNRINKTVVIRLVTIREGQSLDTYRSPGAYELRTPSQSFRGSVALADRPGDGRTQPPTAPTVYAQTTVLLDGREIRAAARTVISEAESRTAWRATAGRR
jgi:hypothetical protein